MRGVVMHTNRRRLVQTAGVGAVVLGVLAVTGCTPSSQATTSSAAVVRSAANLPPGDLSNGADNFYTSDRVTVQKVSFRNQYGMNVVGNLFVPRDFIARPTRRIRR